MAVSIIPAPSLALVITAHEGRGAMLAGMDEAFALKTLVSIIEGLLAALEGARKAAKVD